MTIKTLYRHFYQHPEGNWIVIWENAEQLYNFILETPVKKVLDLGTGIGLSSSIVALALKDKGETDYHIDTVEQYDKCVKLANEIIPEELKKNITIHKSETEAWSTDIIPYTYFSVYKTLPGWDYDIIIQDGPAPWKEEEKYIDLPNGTIHKGLIEGKLKPGTFIVWDGRLVALNLLERYFEYNFYIIKPPKSPTTDFNVIQRKDNELKVGDWKMERVAQLGYFNDPKTVSETKSQESLSQELPKPQL